MKKVIRIGLMVIGGLIAATALAFLVGLLVQALWNALMPEIFGLPEVSYWQGVGLLVLGHLLFGGGIRGHSQGRRHKERIDRARCMKHPEPVIAEEPGQA